MDAGHGKKNVRRLSDLLPTDKSNEKQKKKPPSIGSKRDVWLITFTDVVIRCQRVAVTRLPMAGPPNSAEGAQPPHHRHRQSVTLTNKERNLYRFLRVENWIMDDQTTGKRAGMISMEDVVKSRSPQAHEDMTSAYESELEALCEDDHPENGGDSRMRCVPLDMFGFSWMHLIVSAEPDH